MDKSLRKVFIYGKLKQLLGRDYIELSGETVAELIEGVSANYRKELTPTPGKPRMVCRVRGFDTEASLYRPLTDEETEIHLYPTLMGGGGNGGLMKIIIGAILIAVVVAAVIMSGGTLLAPATWALTQFGAALLMTGISMVIGGIMDLMAPQPKTDLSTSNDLESSKYLGANTNTIKIGTPIPILMGEHMAYGHFISFNVDATNVAA